MLNLSRIAPNKEEDVRHTIHLFNGFLNPCGGSELETLSLYQLLLQAKADVHLWATSSRASARLRGQFPIQRVSMSKAAYPRGGNYVFLGAHWRNKFWPYCIPVPRRLIYVFNTFHPKVIPLTAKIPALLRWPHTEFVLISEFQKRLLGLNGVVHPSPIDIGRFLPDATQQAGRAFTVGRLSRDAPNKHNPEDVALYQEWLGLGWQVRMQGATYLADQLAQHDRLQLLPEGEMPAEQFLAGLDVFYYRTGEHVETFGRVVFEAMACGLPVVCHSHGGYADHIRHGENGFLFDTSAQARQIMAELHADPALRKRIGNNARATVEALFSDAAQNERLDFYMR
jgi:glycosyltransferase involved in cell wall biosynthesis